MNATGRPIIPYARKGGSLDLTVFFAVLAAALLHAGWNIAVKVGLDRAASVLLLALVQAAIALPILPFMPLPEPTAWPWIAASAALHAGYKIFLVQAYRHADLSQAYPLARGGATLFVSLFSIIVLGVAFEMTEIAAILIIAGGVVLMGLKGGHGAPMTALAAFFALGTAAFTASYTLVDGVGARIAGSASSYTLWMVVGDAALMALYAALKTGRAAFPPLLPAWRTGLAAGAMSLGSYWIAVWAFTQAPIALVAALRESSILFAVLMAAFVLREPVSLARWISAGLIALGLVVMRF